MTSLSPSTTVPPPLSDLPREKLPQHVAIIMDGNGRWAQRQGLLRIEGHRRGATSVRKTTIEAARLGLKQLTLFCLSSENWKRPQLELDCLMHLLEQYMIEERTLIMEKNITVSLIGRRAGIAPAALAEIDRTIEMSAHNTGMNLCLAINYGSRGEMLDAIRSIAHEVQSGSVSPDELTEESISSHLYTAGMSDPDLLIRTANEMRISNFLLWQISYAEIWVTEKCWPDFREEDLQQALRDYAARDRRFGGLG